MFSLLVSSNVTLFFGADLAIAAAVLLVAVPARARVVVLLGASPAGRAASVAVFLRGRPLVLGSLAGSEAAAFATRVRVTRAAVSEPDWLSS